MNSFFKLVINHQARKYILPQALHHVLPECSKIKQQLGGNTCNLSLFSDPDHLWDCFMVRYHKKIKIKTKTKEAMRVHRVLHSCLLGEAWRKVKTECQETEMTHRTPRKLKIMQKPKGQVDCLLSSNSVSGKRGKVAQVKTSNKFSDNTSLCVSPNQQNL